MRQASLARFVNHILIFQKSQDISLFLICLWNDSLTEASALLARAPSKKWTCRRARMAPPETGRLICRQQAAGDARLFEESKRPGGPGRRHV
jgi:hypothetical protein